MAGDFLDGGDRVDGTTGVGGVSVTRERDGNQIIVTETLPTGQTITYQYKRGVNQDKREADARKTAVRQAENEWARQEFSDLYDQDFYEGLDDYLPDYDALRAGFPDESEQANALNQGAAQFQDIYDQGGYTALERGQIEQAQMQARAGEKSQRDAQQQQMQMRGMGGSGLEAMGAMNAQQQGANASLSASTDIAAQAQQRALGALTQGTQFAGQGGQAADAFNQANLGWQNTISRQQLADQAELQRREEERRRWGIAAATSREQGEAAPDYNTTSDIVDTSAQTANNVTQSVT